jgi:chorismate-pyruvate lyase
MRGLRAALVGSGPNRRGFVRHITPARGACAHARSVDFFPDLTIGDAQPGDDDALRRTAELYEGPVPEFIGRGGGPLRLDPLDRMLLAADGTVTTLLEACTGEPISTATVRMAGPATIDELLSLTGPWWHPDAALLGLERHEPVIVRRAVLRGGRTGRPYLLAESLVTPSRLPSAMADGLARPGASIGRLLKSSGAETRRELLDVGRMRASEATEYLETGPAAEIAWRTYRIEMGGRPVVLLAEMIPPGRLAGAAGSTSTLTRRPNSGLVTASRRIGDHQLGGLGQRNGNH